MILKIGLRKCDGNQKIDDKIARKIGDSMNKLIAILSISVVSIAIPGCAKEHHKARHTCDMESNYSEIHIASLGALEDVIENLEIAFQKLAMHREDKDAFSKDLDIASYWIDYAKKILWYPESSTAYGLYKNRDQDDHEQSPEWMLPNLDHSHFYDEEQ